MGKETITFGDIEVEKQIFHSHKNPVSIYDVNIDKIVISNKVSFGKRGFKYFIGYENSSRKTRVQSQASNEITW